MEKQLPNNKAAEAKVLSILLDVPESIDTVIEVLKSEHFYSNEHRTIYETMLALHRNHEPADQITVTERLEQENRIGQAGGYDMIMSLASDIPPPMRLIHYARMIVKSWKLRRAIWVNAQSTALAYDGDESAISFAENELFKIGQGEQGLPISSHRDSMSRYMDTLLDLYDQNNAGTLSGVSTGYKYVNKKLGGFRHSKLYILAGRPGDGKTALALCFAWHAAKRGCQVLFFSIEMDEDELMQRLLAMESGVNSKNLRDGTLSREVDSEGLTEWERVIAAQKRLDEMPGTIWIDATPANDIGSMRAKTRRAIAEHGVDLVIVDYLQLAEVGEEETRKAENRRLEVELVSRNLKRIAREYKVPVLALAQMNRNVESRANRKPQLSDLREAGGIEADADAVMFIYRDPTIDENSTKYPVSLLIEKNRNGERGSVPLLYDGRFTRFYTMEPPIGQEG